MKEQKKELSDKQKKEPGVKEYMFETECVHAGYHPQNGESRILPIYQSTTYKYDSADDVADLFDLKANGYMYSRISNPTVDALEKKIARLEGGTGAVATSSGQAAITLAVLTLCEAGDNFIAMSNLYGGTINLFSSTLPKLGINPRFVTCGRSEAAKAENARKIAALIDQKTKFIYAETIGNPGVEVLDIAWLADIAHESGLALVVDNTFATPYLCRPFEHGADVIVHSSTKYLDGHATSVGGLLVDKGNLDLWTNGRFSRLTDEDPSYHGLSYTEAFGAAAFCTRARVVYVRDLGVLMSPMNAWLTNLGMETLPLRMEKHSANALAVAEFLEKHECVDWVSYPGLGSSADKALADKYLPRGASGVIAFGVKGGVDAGKKFIDALELISLVVHVADVRSHVLHPASMTHRQLSAEQQAAAGIRPEQIRLSVGIECLEDIIADLDRALGACNGERK